MFLRCNPHVEFINVIMDQIESWKLLCTLTGTTAVCTMFLKRPTDGSTSSVKARTVKLSVTTQKKIKHLSSKAAYMKNWYMDLLF